VKKAKGLKCELRAAIKSMPSQGRTRQAHVKRQDIGGGPDRRGTGLLRREHLVAERRPQRRRAGEDNGGKEGLVPNGIGHGVRFPGGHPCSYMYPSDEDVAVLRGFQVRRATHVCRR
jgi:hypothetical protein